VTLGLSLLHMIVALLVAWLRPDVFFVIFPFAFLALFTAWAAYHSHWRNNALRAQEEKLFKRVVRRIEAEQEKRIQTVIECVLEHLQSTAATETRRVELAKLMANQFELMWPVWSSKLRALAGALGKEVVRSADDSAALVESPELPPQ